MSHAHRLPLVLASALVFVPVMTAEATQQYPLPRSPRVIVSQGFESGYARGLTAGQEDRRRGEPFNFTDESDYRRADSGYRREYGPINAYRAEFRRGFESGYRAVGGRRGGPVWGEWDGGRGRGRFGGPGDRYDVASAQGFADGYNAGFDDGDRHRRHELASEGRYRSADHGYERWYGPRETYRANYREGFRQGYDDGYERGLRSRPW